MNDNQEINNTNREIPSELNNGDIQNQPMIQENINPQPTVEMNPNNEIPPMNNMMNSSGVNPNVIPGNVPTIPSQEPNNVISNPPSGNGNTNDMISNNENPTPPEKKNNNIIFIVIGVVALAVIAIAVKTLFTTRSNSNKSSNVDNSITDTNVFFIENSNQKYALFNENGDKITDFLYDKVGTFYDGSVLVEKDDKNALINTKGKEVVGFDKYEYFGVNCGSLYKVNDGNNDYIIDSKGTKVYTFKDEKRRDLNCFVGKDLYAYTVDGDKIIVWNYKGKKMKEYTAKEEANSKGYGSDELDDYFGDWRNQYSSIYYDGELTIFDNNNFTEVFNGKVDHPYILGLVAYKNQTFILEPLSYVDLEYGKNKKLGYVYNHKFSEINFKDILSDSMGDGTFYLVGESYDDSKDYYIHKDGSKGELESETYPMSEEDYVISPSSSNLYVEFYVKGKKVTRLEKAYVRDVGQKGYYLVHLQDEDYKKTWYDINGKRILENSYADLSLLDDNNRATARDEKDSKEYLIDENGKKISDGYDEIRDITKDDNNLIQTDYYSVELDNKYGVIDKDGKLVVDIKYTERLDTIYRVKVISKGNLTVCAAIDKETEECYSTKNGTIITNKRYSIDMNGQYITSKDEKTKKTEYYAFNGKKLEVN